MKLSRALSILNHMRHAFSIGLMPTLRAVLASPGLLLRPQELSRVYMAELWAIMGDGPDDTKAKLITPHAYGVVLDLGAGHGNILPYLDKTRVTRYIALEPNTFMHASIRAEAHKIGFNESNGSLVILGCGAEDTNTILQYLKEISGHAGNPVQIDTVVSIRTLCTVPNAPKAMENLICDAVKPGGQFLMYEHVRNKRQDVAWWQHFWTPLWSVVFDGCKLDRDTDVWVKDLQKQVAIDGTMKRASVWRDIEMWGVEGDEEDSMLWHSVGRFVKA
ncbi:hypothetical protein D9619_004741 [Psilocybe cf. subviscida]|uniref:Methyltransferase type 11 domain-containing protein n=1 Tax=Psilocybe cf. subviscida TaxID=2480587 RepID=A0A8H5BQD1_9AGAR|nr:hypothetical protein D9619_004741 [Psilocybe cf. subviscida]